MRQFISLASLLLAGIVLVGCSGSKEDEFAGIPSQELYDKGQQYLQKGDYSNAVRYLDAVNTQAVAGVGEQIQLNLIYANYKLSEYGKALEEAERFVRIYPNSSRMDYVYYLAGLSNARLGDNFVQDLFRRDNSARAVESVRNAYGSFQALVQKFPQSQYVADAQQWMAYLKNRLAEHELNIVEFYMKRDAYVAVANRVQEMLRYYPDSQATHQALPLLQKAFEAMGVHDSARNVAAMIEANQGKSFSNIAKPEYKDDF